MSLPHDLKDFRAPRWHDAIGEHAPDIIIIFLIISFMILVLVLDRAGVWA